VKVKQAIKKLIFGLSIPQQYLCVDLESLEGLKAFVILSNGSSISIDQIFVGYKPVILAFNDVTNALGNGDIVVEHRDGKGRTISTLWLRPVTVNFNSCPELKLFEVTKGKHAFLNGLHQWTNRVKGIASMSQPGNIDLPGNLHDRVRIAYSLPRTISLVSVQKGMFMNLFPTDLHGRVNEKFYLSSLRIGGKAQQQVEEVGRVVICDVSSDAYRAVYTLGKNHMKDMTSAEQFDLLPNHSEKFGFGVPRKTLRYFELEVADFMDAGIHRIYLYKIKNQKVIGDTNTLAHIHQYYAQWRLNHGLETTYLLR
jgi:flavin reductase (DIM6/NTAB) family NADH-FMN oxidoreductase RutF